MIRNLRPDEVAWFVGRSLHYLGHSDPKGMSLRLAARFSDPVEDAGRCFVLDRPDAAPSAGAYFRAPDPDDDVGTAVIGSPWHHDDPVALRELIGGLLERHRHEAAVVELHSLDPGRREELAAQLTPLGFYPDELLTLCFELSETPPLGAPLVFEAWSSPADREFRRFYQEAEARPVSDAGWAFLKRRHGPFYPDLWFLARETLDQEAVGYAFCGCSQRRLDGQYSLDGAGVRSDLRSDSEMLRRLVISLLNELAGLSPLGAVNAELSASDPKLVKILRGIGFQPVARTPVLFKPPA